MQELVQDYIKHHFSGYDIENEIISYAELHFPKIKYDEHKNKRYPHIHLGVSFLNLLSDTKLRNLFANNSFYDEVMVRKSNFKFDFEQTKKREFRVPNFVSQVGRDRREWIEIFENLNDRDELLYFLENQINFKEGIDYKIVNTKNNNYVKLIGKSFKTDKSGKKTVQDINLQGKGFERFVDVNLDVKNYKKLEDMTQEELEEILNDVYAKRVEEIFKRRSKKSKELLENIYEDDKELKKDFEKKYSKNSNCNSLKSLIFQEKIFYKHYGKRIKKDSLQGYYIKVDNEKNSTTFINQSVGINIEDRGDEIISLSKTDSIENEVRLMLDIAIAKGWNLLEIEIDGRDEFKKEAKKQILQKVEEQNQVQKEEKKEMKKVEKSTRPVSLLDNYILDNKLKIFESEKVHDIQFLKENLSAQIVLNFAKQKYNINLDEFEVIDGNKINNKTNRQKPKSIIDFFTKEIGISLREATEICNDLIAKQPKFMDEVEDSEKLEELVQQHQEIHKDSKVESTNKQEEVTYHSKKINTKR